MIGMSEVLIGLGVIAVVALLGKKTVKKLTRDAKEIKEEWSPKKEVKQEQKIIEQKII